MKKEEKDKTTKKVEEAKPKTKEKNQTKSTSGEIGFDDKRTQESKKSNAKSASEKPKVVAEKGRKKSAERKVVEVAKTKKQQRAERAYEAKVAREEKRQLRRLQWQEKREEKAKKRAELRALKHDRTAYLEAKAQKRAERAKKKEESAKRRAEKFQEKKRAFVSKIESRKEQREERKEARYQEKIHRAGLTKEEKRTLKREEKEEAKAQRAYRKAHKQQRKAEKKQAIAQLRQKGIKVGSSKGLIAAVITLSIVGGVAVVSSVAMGSANVMYMREIDRTYMQSYYEVMESANSLVTSLAKSKISTDNVGLSTNFAKASTDAYKVESSLENIPCKDYAMQDMAKFFNQTGEFAKMMSQKCIRESNISIEDKEIIAKIEKTATQIKDQINKAYNESGKAERKMHAVSHMFKGEYIPDISSNMQDISNSTIEYPTMIYDGPFSDAKNKTTGETKAKQTISVEEAKQIVAESLRAKNPEFITETNAEKVSTYDFKFTENGTEVYVQVSKECGKIVMLDAYKRVPKANISESTAEEKAKEYLNVAGFEDMVKVWGETSGNITTFNFAKLQNGSVIYPQLVKVKVALSDGKILGAEGYSYIKNKAERSEKPKISLAKAREKISKDLRVKTEKLVVIPMGNSEKLCYEFMGTVDGQTFYVYIDAKTGDQADVQMVVESGDEGSKIL